MYEYTINIIPVSYAGCTHAVALFSALKIYPNQIPYEKITIDDWHAAEKGLIYITYLSGYFFFFFCSLSVGFHFNSLILYYIYFFIIIVQIVDTKIIIRIMFGGLFMSECAWMASGSEQTEDRRSMTRMVRSKEAHRRQRWGFHNSIHWMAYNVFVHVSSIRIRITRFRGYINDHNTLIIVCQAEANSQACDIGETGEKCHDKGDYCRTIYWPFLLSSSVILAWSVVFSAFRSGLMNEVTR